jgi:Tol biopolymer transport system component
MREAARFDLAALLVAAVLAVAVGLASPAAAGERSKPPAPEPPKIVAPTDEEIKAELAKETPEQKALRAELEALAKAGQKVYYNANLGEGGRNEIFVMGPDGSGVKQLTKEGAEYPHTPADGSRVCFVSSRIPLKLPLPAELKEVPVDPKFPLEKPPEQKWDRRRSGSVVWIMNPDGSDPKPAAFGCLPHFSPDGKFICYSIVSPPWPNQLAILNLEKKTDACISHPGLRNCGMPCFSPDGNYVVGANGSAFCVKLNAEKTAVENVFQFDNGHPCNGEISADGKFWTCVYDTDKDQGGWLGYWEMDYEKPSKKRISLPLQHQKGSVNYFPEISPDGRYLVYVHADQQPGVKSWTLKVKQEVHVTRFPKCEATVRVTWNGGANQHPHWAAK